jgi:hypothetical protein
VRSSPRILTSTSFESISLTRKKMMRMIRKGAIILETKITTKRGDVKLARG